MIHGPVHVVINASLSRATRILVVVAHVLRSTMRSVVMNSQIAPCKGLRPWHAFCGIAAGLIRQEWLEKASCGPTHPTTPPTPPPRGLCPSGPPDTTTGVSRPVGGRFSGMNAGPHLALGLAGEMRFFASQAVTA